MSKIRDVITINSGYTSYVDLSQDFFYYNEEQNLCYEKDHSKIREKYKEFTGTINKEMLKKMFELTTNCGAGHSQYVMSPMGIIRPCALGPEEWFLIGNIFESSVDKIFSNSLISFFENLPRPNKDKEPCNTCENKFLCGYCWVRAVNKNISEKLNCPWFEKSGIAKYLQIKK